MYRVLLFVIILFLSSGIPLLSFDPVRNYSEQVHFLEHLGSHFSSHVIGVVTYQDTAYPIYKISFNDRGISSQDKYLVISGVHGNEPAPVYAVKDFILELNDREDMENYPAMDFLYIVNPWGFEFNQRNNGEGFDINRDLHSLNSQEIRILHNALNASDYDRVFDFHEANASGFFLYCYGNNNSEMAQDIIDFLIIQDVELENEYTDRILTVDNGILFVPFYANLYMTLKGTITNGLFFHRQGISNVFTFETSKNQPLDERIRINRILLEYILTL